MAPRSRVMDARTMLFHYAQNGRLAYLVVHQEDRLPGITLGVTGSPLRELSSPSYEDAQGLAREFVEVWSRHPLANMVCTFHNLLFPLQHFERIIPQRLEGNCAEIIFQFKDAPSYSRVYSSVEVAEGHFDIDLREVRELMQEIEDSLKEHHEANPLLYH